MMINEEDWINNQDDYYKDYHTNNHIYHYLRRINEYFK